MSTSSRVHGTVDSVVYVIIPTTVRTAASLSSPKSSSIVPTKIYIDSVPEYSQLSSCAEPQVSSIVRGMTSGCGDGSRTTSYACFCYSSSSMFDSIISAQVASACNDEAQATSAQAVFGKYCQIGVTRGITPAAAVPSATLSAVEPTTPPPLSSFVSSMSQNTSSIASKSTWSTFTTSSSISSPTSDLNPGTSNGRTTTIAVAVTVPTVVLSLMLGLFLTYRYWNRNTKRWELAADKLGGLTTEPPVEKYSHNTVELPTQQSFFELPVQQRSNVELPIHSPGGERARLQVSHEQDVIGRMSSSRGHGEIPQSIT